MVFSFSSPKILEKMLIKISYHKNKNPALLAKSGIWDCARLGRNRLPLVPGVEFRNTDLSHLVKLLSEVHRQFTTTVRLLAIHCKNGTWPRVFAETPIAVFPNEPTIDSLARSGMVGFVCPEWVVAHFPWELRLKLLHRPNGNFLFSPFCRDNLSPKPILAHHSIDWPRLDFPGSVVPKLLVAPAISARGFTRPRRPKIRNQDDFVGKIIAGKFRAFRPLIPHFWRKLGPLETSDDFPTGPHRDVEPLTSRGISKTKTFLGFRVSGSEYLNLGEQCINFHRTILSKTGLKRFAFLLGIHYLDQP